MSTDQVSTRVTRRDPAGWVLLCGALACLLVAAFYPISGQSSRFTWVPESENHIPFVMVALAPETLDAEFTCPDADSVPTSNLVPQTLFSTAYGDDDGLVVQKRGSSIWATNRTIPIAGLQVDVIPGSACRISLGFDGSDGTVRLTVDGVEKVGSIDETWMANWDPKVPRMFSISSLYVEPSASDQARVVVQLPPNTMDYPMVSAVSVGLGLLLLALWYTRLPRRASAEGPRPRARWWRWDRIDTSVVLSAVIAWIVNPPLFDDGWVLSTVRAFPELGFFSNFFTVGNAAQPMGYWWTTIERLWLSNEATPVALLRIPAALLVVIGWVVLRRYVLEAAVGGWRRSAIWMAAITYCLYVFAFSPTLRPEPLIALLLVIELGLVARFHTSAEPRVLTLLAAVPAIAVACHHTGLLVACAGLAALPDLWAWMRGDQAARRVVGSVVVSAGLLLGLLLMMGSNLSVLDSSQKAFEAQATGFHSRVLQELPRIAGLEQGNLPSVRQLAIGVLYLAAILFVASPKPPIADVTSRLGWAGVAAVAGLVLTPSKWAWHYAALGPVVAVLVAIAWQRWSLYGSWPTVRIRAFAVGVVILGAMATRVVLDWLPGAQVTTSAESLSQSLPTSSLALWLMLLVVVLASVSWALRRSVERGTRALLVWMGVVLALVAVDSWAPLVVDLRQAGSQSWIGINTGSMLGRPCGLGDSLPLPTSSTAIAPEPGFLEATSKLGGEGPTGERLPAIGSFVYSPDPLTGTAITPWFPVESQMISWMQTRNRAATTYTLEWEDMQGRVGTRDVTQSSADMWQLVDLTVPEGATRVRVRWTAEFGPLAVMQPQQVTGSASLRTVASGQPVWTNPSNRLFASCFTSPSLATGVVDPYMWSVGVADTAYLGLDQSSPLAQMACPPYEISAINRNCVYWSQNNLRLGLRREVIQQRW